MLGGEETLSAALRRRMAMEEAFELACSCAYCLVCREIRQGERLGFLSFFDDEPDSQTRGERVLECPGCGKRLGLALFFLHPSG
jgi:hypothetical protein